MSAKFEIKKNAGGMFHFSLAAANGEKILSGETYTSKAGAREGAESVVRNAANDSRYERKSSSNGESYFVLKASNGQIIGTSETYSTAAAMENGIEAVKSNALSAGIVDSTGI